VPALIVAAAKCGIADLKTVTALTSNEVKSAFVKAGPIAASYRSTGPRPAACASAQTETALSNSDSQRQGAGAAQETPGNAEAATAILNAEKRAVDDICAGRAAPYYFAPSGVPSQRASSPRGESGAAKKKK